MSIALRSPFLRAAFLCAGTATLAGCMGPTYGTGVGQSQQLFNDLDNIVTLGSTNRGQIDYAERKTLERPSTIGTLPQPQVADTATIELEAAQAREEARVAGLQDMRDRAAARPDPRSRVGRRAEVEQNWLSVAQMRGESQQAQSRATTGRQGSPTERRFLTEPPLAYRAPAATAPAGERGVDEEIKERRASSPGTIASRLKNILPF